jgi:colanic acid biosynthesis glycosyl transferase WcaI
MHVLLVTHYFTPDGGAAATRLGELAQRLQQRGHRINVLTTMPHYPQGEIAATYRGSLFRRETIDGIDIIRSWLWTTPSSHISPRLLSQLSFMVTAALRGIPLERPDVVLIEAQPIFTGLAGRFISRLKRVPYVLNVSDLWPDHLLTTGTLTENHPIYHSARWLVDSGYRGAAGIVGMSPLWSQKITAYLNGQAEKVHTILRGCDTQYFQPIADTRAFREKYGFGDKKIVSFIGTFATQYDFQVIMDVAARLQARDDTLVVMIGTGSQREYVQTWVESEHMPNFRLIDWLPHDEMPLAWNASTVTYWAMHDHELFTGTLPAKLFEAMACGTPIVTAQSGEVPKILAMSGGGLSVPVGDTAGLVTTIERILNDEDLRQKLATKGRAYAEREFDFDIVTQRYEAILQAVVERRKTIKTL